MNKQIFIVSQPGWRGKAREAGAQAGIPASILLDLGRKSLGLTLKRGVAQVRGDLRCLAHHSSLNIE